MFLHLFHLLNAFLFIFPSPLDSTYVNPSHWGKALHVERSISTNTQDRGGLECLSNTKEVYVGEMEGVRGWLMGDENRDIIQT